jgi:hypothetical protein
MQEEIAWKNKLSCTNKCQIEDLGKYLDTLHINDLER